VVEQLFDVVETELGGQAKIDRCHLERLASRLFSGRQSQSKISVHDLLERLAGLADLLFEQGRNIVVEGKSRSHIMMLM